MFVQALSGRSVRLAIAGLVAIATAVVLAAASPGAGATVWLCKPGVQPDPCAPGLSTTAFNAPLTQAVGVEHPKAGRKPAVDCFYVYPTVSDEKTGNSDLQIQNTEQSIALYQVSRYSQYCKVYAPMYRQVTLAGAGLGGASTTKANPALGLSDVENAFEDYLRHDNHGRGFVLIGHSQGAGVLEAVIAKEVDPKPAVPDGWQRAGKGQHRYRRRLQAHPGVPPPDGARVRDRIFHLRSAGAERQPVRSPRRVDGARHGDAA